MKPPEVLASVDAEVCTDAAPLEKKKKTAVLAGQRTCFMWAF